MCGPGDQLNVNGGGSWLRSFPFLVGSHPLVPVLRVHGARCSPHRLDQSPHPGLVRSRGGTQGCVRAPPPIPLLAAPQGLSGGASVDGAQALSQTRVAAGGADGHRGVGEVVETAVGRPVLRGL